MGNLLKYWYIVVIAFIASFMSAVGLIYLRQDQWLPPEGEAEPAIDLSEGDSASFQEWNFRANELEEIKLKLDSRKSGLDSRSTSLDARQAQIENERAELIKLRQSLVALSESIEQDFIAIDVNELANLQQLATIYSEVKAAATINVFKSLDNAVVVKILSLMSSESSARILGEMGQSTDDMTLKRAAELTNDFRKIKK